MPEPVVIAAMRSPIGRAHNGYLRDVRHSDRVVSMTPAAFARLPGINSQQALAKAGTSIGEVAPGAMGEGFGTRVLPAADALAVDMDRCRADGGVYAAPPVSCDGYEDGDDATQQSSPA